MRRWEFPVRIGSHLEMKKPALEFVKIFCEIVGLDSEFAEEVTMLRKNLLFFLKSSDFTADTKFVEPSLVLVLPDVNCDFCQNAKDLDLCREGELKCNVCGREYI